LEKSLIGTPASKLGKTAQPITYDLGGGLKIKRILRSDYQAQLEADKTGFDVLVEHKDANIKAILQMVKKKPNLTRREVMDALHISDRTATRYFGIIRKLKPDLLKTSVDEEMADKAKRIAQMKKLMTEHPELTREQVRAKLGVSRRTLYKYLSELPMVTNE